jgi:AcrR family transcriptional regulator
MRRLSTELGVTPGALYRHVSGQSELLALMIDDVMERIEMPDAGRETDPWQRIRLYVQSLTRVLDAYPGLDRLIADHAATSAPARLRQQWFVEQLQAAGLSRADARRSYGVIQMYWLGSRQPGIRSRATFFFGLDRLLDGLRGLGSATAC